MTSGSGRNDPCRCGSGRKYKKCCLHKTGSAGPNPASPVGDSLSGKAAPPVFDKAVVAVVASEYPLSTPLFEDLERFVASSYKSYRTSMKIATAHTQKDMNATLVEQIQSNIMYFQVSFGRRLTDFLAGVILHINEYRLLDAALSARACLEFSGALAFYLAKVQQHLVNGISTQEDMDKLSGWLDKAARGGRFRWEDWMLGGVARRKLVEAYAKKDSTATAASTSQKNVTDFIDAGDALLSGNFSEPSGSIRMLYSLLSDICHPAAGGYMLYFNPQSPPGWHVFDAFPSKEMATRIVAAAMLPAAVSSARIARHCFHHLNHLAGSVTAIDESALH